MAPRTGDLLHDGRDRVYTWLRRCLIGPADGAEAGPINGIKPLERWQSGILFPVLADAHGLDAEIDDADDEAEGSDLAGDNAPPTAKATNQPKRRFVPPSSIGFSFYVEGDAIRLQVIPRAVRFEPADEQTRVGRADHWDPVALGRGDADAAVFTPPASRRRQRDPRPVFADRAEVMVLWRPLGAGWLVTVSLSNRQQDPGQGDDPRRAAERNASALFQVALACVIDEGRVGDYPRVDPALLDDEERELELQYRHHRIYAIGHGAAVDWQVTDGRVTQIWTDFLPRVEVPQVSADGGPADAQVLAIDWLADIEVDPTARFAALSAFAERYRDWVAAREAAALAALAPTVGRTGSVPICTCCATKPTACAGCCAATVAGRRRPSTRGDSSRAASRAANPGYAAHPRTPRTAPSLGAPWRSTTRGCTSRRCVPGW